MKAIFKIIPSLFISPIIFSNRPMRSNGTLKNILELVLKKSNFFDMLTD